MKKVMITLAVALALRPALSQAQEISAEEIVVKANNVLNQESMQAKSKMVITTSSGKRRELFYDSWMKNRGQKNLIRYTAPRRVKDQAMLLLNNSNDIWNYDPRTNRVRKLASHAKKQKMQGSDFSYEDMGSGDSFITDFTSKLLGETKVDGRACYSVELNVRDGVDSNYSRLIMAVDKELYVIWEIEYYDEDDPGLQTKLLKQSDLKIIEEVPTPFNAVMHNKLDNTNTVVELIEVKYGIDLKDTMFTERGLKK